MSKRNAIKKIIVVHEDGSSQNIDLKKGKLGAAKNTVRRLFESILSDSVPSEKVFKKMFPGESEAVVALRGARHREGLTQEELANKLGIAQSNLAGMESGTRPIGKEMAKRLSEILR